MHDTQPEDEMSQTVIGTTRIVTQTCNLPAAYRYTWQGKDEEYVCEEHVEQLHKIAEIVGLHLELFAVYADAGLACQQFVRAE
jgi:hypothetical protein